MSSRRVRMGMRGLGGGGNLELSLNASVVNIDVLALRAKVLLEIILQAPPTPLLLRWSCHLDRKPPGMSPLLKSGEAWWHAARLCVPPSIGTVAAA